MPPPRIIVVDGEIGAGKSTLITMLKNELIAAGRKVVAVLEPVELWREVGILARFMRDPARYAYEFQTFTYVTRIQSVIDAVANAPEAEIVLLERSIFTDRYVFMELQRKIVGPETMKMYEQWCDLFSRLMPVDLSKATFLYLKPKLDRCMARVAKRARSEELCTRQNRRALMAKLLLGLAILAAAVAPGALTRALLICALLLVLSERWARLVAQDVPAKGGVGRHYQEMLREAHEALLENKNMEKYPLLQRRPFPILSAVVIDGAAADEDFTAPGPHRANTVATIINRLKL